MFEINSYDENGSQIYYFTQWDLNRKLVLYLQDYDLSVLPEVHFCNKKSSEALVVQSSKYNNGNAIIVDVPNVLLQQPYPVSAYVYMSNLKNDEQKTIVSTTIVVNARVKPASYIYEDNVDYDTSQIEDKIYERLVAYISSGYLVATTDKFGLVKASEKTDDETVEAKIGKDGKLYVSASTNVSIDTTLTLEGSAADAKTVGDLIGSLDKTIESLEKRIESLEKDKVSEIELLGGAS